MVMYADDTTLYCNLSYNTNENDLNSELHKISEWLASNKLSLNAQKTKFMGFHSMQRKAKYPVLILGQNPPDKTLRTKPPGQNPPDKTPRTKPPGQNPPDKTPRTKPP